MHSDLRQRLATALRTTSATMVTAIPDDDTAISLATALEKLNQYLLTAAQRLEGLDPDTPSLKSFDADNFSTLRSSTSPITGSCNPLASPATIYQVNNEVGSYVEGYVQYGVVYQGRPGYVHGGVIAQLFDGFLGAANVAAGNPGMTGTLTVRHLEPTPLRTLLRVEGHCRRREGRKIYSWGGLYDGEVLTAEADGIFIDVTAVGFRGVAQSGQHA